MKAMSIIGIVWFSLSVTCIVVFFEYNHEISILSGFLGMLYAIALAIVGVAQSSKKNVQPINLNVTQELFKLNELREKGILTEDEFQNRKVYLLNM
jgi:Ca2+/Na+ antiporter